MENPLNKNVRAGLYFALLLLGVITANAPDIAFALQTGDWNAAGLSATATIAQISGIIALSNLTPDNGDREV